MTFRVILTVANSASISDAGRAAQWMIAHPDQKTSAIIAYGSDPNRTFLVKRNKSSISVIQAEPAK